METVDSEEIAKFAKISSEWWEPEGKFKPLHQINPVRVGYVCTQLVGSAEGMLTDMEIVDIGCGGGILSEALDQRGARVTAIDRSEHIIGAAKAHQQESGSKVDYQLKSAKLLGEERPASFDVVMAMEVLEHVPNVPSFLAECSVLLKPGGTFFFATLNRTIKAWTLAIAGAEYVLGWLPRGTHSYSKFIRPSELDQDLRCCGIQMRDIRGMSYAPLKDEWYLSQDPDVNYLGYGLK